MLDEFAVTGSYDEIPGLLKAKYGDMLDEVLIYFGEPEKDAAARWRRSSKRSTKVNSEPNEGGSD